MSSPPVSSSKLPQIGADGSLTYATVPRRPGGLANATSKHHKSSAGIHLQITEANGKTNAFTPIAQPHAKKSPTSSRKGSASSSRVGSSQNLQELTSPTAVQKIRGALLKDSAEIKNSRLKTATKLSNAALNEETMKRSQSTKSLSDAMVAATNSHPKFDLLSSGNVSRGSRASLNPADAGTASSNYSLSSSKALGSDASIANYNSIMKQADKTGGTPVPKPPESPMYKSQKGLLSGMLRSGSGKKKKKGEVTDSQSHLSNKSITSSDNNTISVPIEFVSSPASVQPTISSPKAVRKLPPIAQNAQNNTQTQIPSTNSQSLMLFISSKEAPSDTKEDPQLTTKPIGVEASPTGRSPTMAHKQRAEKMKSGDSTIVGRFKDVMKYVEKNVRESIVSMRSQTQTSSTFSNSSKRSRVNISDEDVSDIPPVPTAPLSVMPKRTSMPKISESVDKLHIERDLSIISLGSQGRQLSLQLSIAENPRSTTSSHVRKDSAGHVTLNSIDRKNSLQQNSRKTSTIRIDTDEEAESIHLPALKRQKSLRDLFRALPQYPTNEPIVEQLTFAELELIFTKDFGTMDKRESEILINHLNQQSKRLSIYAKNKIEVISWDKLEPMLMNLYRLHVITGHSMLDASLSKPLIEMMRQDGSIEDKICAARLLFKSLPRSNMLKLKMNLCHLRRLCFAMDEYGESVIAPVATLFATIMVTQPVVQGSRTGKSLQVKDLFGDTPKPSPDSAKGFRMLASPSQFKLPSANDVSPLSPFAPKQELDPIKAAELQAEREYEEWILGKLIKRFNKESQEAKIQKEKDELKKVESRRNKAKIRWLELREKLLQMGPQKLGETIEDNYFKSLLDAGMKFILSDYITRRGISPVLFLEHRCPTVTAAALEFLLRNLDEIL